MYLLLLLLLADVRVVAERVVAERVVAFALLVRLAIGLFGFLLVYLVVADRERACSAVVFLAAVFCRLLLERLVAPAAVIELFLRVVALVLFTLRVLSPFATVLAPAVVPVAEALVLRLLPLVSLASFDLP